MSEITLRDGDEISPNGNVVGSSATKPIRKEYAHHKPSEEAQRKLQRMRHAFSTLADLIDECAAESRARAIAHTELQSAARAANAAIVFTDPGSTAVVL